MYTTAATANDIPVANAFRAVMPRTLAAPGTWTGWYREFAPLQQENHGLLQNGSLLERLAGSNERAERGRIGRPVRGISGCFLITARRPTGPAPRAVGY